MQITSINTRLKGINKKKILSFQQSKNDGPENPYAKPTGHTHNDEEVMYAELIRKSNKNVQTLLDTTNANNIDLTHCFRLKAALTAICLVISGLFVGDTVLNQETPQCQTDPETHNE